MHKTFSKKIFLIAGAAFVAGLFFFTNFTQAAVLRLVPSATSTIVGTPVQFDLVLDTQGADINAVQAAITFPPDLFTVQLINDGNSIISFWVTPPAQSSSGEVDLAGIIPGGFNGAAAPIASLILEPIASGTANVAIASDSVLANDGQGSDVPTTASDTIVSITNTSGTIPSAPMHSLVTPEPFTPTIEHDPNIFGDQYFLVFQTTDKGTGIDHYEVMEVPTGWFSGGTTWHTAQSPYLLQDQNLSSDIYVRAVDHAGNFIVEEVPAHNPRSGPNILFVDAGIILVLIVLAWCIWLLKRKRKF